MTRGKSDAQLNAEASRRDLPLNALIALPSWLRHPLDSLEAWQAAYEAELPRRLASWHPPLTTDDVDGVRVPVIDPGTRVGFTMSGSLARYIDGSGGRIFLIHDALTDWDRYCRRAHARWPDHRGDPVCADLVWALVRDRTTLAWASAQAGVSRARAALLMVDAFRFMHSKQEQWIREVENVIPHDREACEKCRREDAA
jgi:hypothetical protein